ncbi:hypothetical protein Pelo_13499 [Pelomyxa schiedti]|nr:hypothetical protein Pelo_13499 [Pelomyxa schiedti]
MRDGKAPNFGTWSTDTLGAVALRKKTSNGDDFNFEIHDIVRMEYEFRDWDRPLSYPGTDLFLLCFRIGFSFFGLTKHEIVQKWFPEAWNNCPGVAIVLVAIAGPRESMSDSFYWKEGVQIADDIGAYAYVEVSPWSKKTNEQTLIDVMFEAINYSPDAKKKPRFFSRLLFGSSSTPPPPSSLPAPVLSSTSGLVCCESIFGPPSVAEPCCRYGHSSAVLHDILYIVGGCDSSKVPARTAQRFNLTTRKWLPPIPLTCSGVSFGGSQFPAACQVGNRIFLYGGNLSDTASSPTASSTVPLDSEIPQSSTVVTEGETVASESTASPPSSTLPSASVSFSRSLFLIEMPDCGLQRLNTCVGPEEPAALIGASLVHWNGKLYLFGGFHSPGMSSHRLYEFNLTTAEWHRVDAGSVTPPGRHYHSAFVTSLGEMFVFGGINEKRIKFSDLWSVNLSEATFTWSCHTSFGLPPTPQRGNRGCLIDDSTFVVVGSANESEACEFSVLDLSKKIWSRAKSEAAPVSREFHSVVPRGQAVFLCGGVLRQTEARILGDGYTFSLFYNPVTRMPHQCWLLVLSYLSAEELCLLGHTCKAFYSLCDDDILWRPFVHSSEKTNLRKTFLSQARKLLWKNSTPKVVKITVDPFKGPNRAACFLGDAYILMSDYSRKKVEDLCDGDLVLSEQMRPRRIALLSIRTLDCMQSMAYVCGVGLTPGHPICLQGEWVHPFTVATPVSTFVHKLYNIVLDGGQQVNDHSVILNGLIVCTLGKDCGPKVREKFPWADELYGTGFWQFSTA